MQCVPLTRLVPYHRRHRALPLVVGPGFGRRFSGVLRVFDGALNGETIKFGQGKRDNAYVAVHQYHRMDDYGAFAAFEASPARIRTRSG